MLPNYSSRLLDKLILIAAQQTAQVRPNPDDEEYLDIRVKVLKTLVKAFWQARNDLQSERDPAFKG